MNDLEKFMFVEESESAAQQVSQKGCEETLYSTGYKHNRCSVRYLSTYIASLVIKYDCLNWIKIKVSEI